jgi:hypothetical protein
VVMQAILSWCERTPVEVAANNLSEYWWLWKTEEMHAGVFSKWCYMQPWGSKIWK